MLTIEIVSDLVCPWCFIGLRRLSTAIEQVRREIPGFSCRKVWRPFFLNPDTPPQGEPYMPFLEAKFGSREAVEALFARVREAGRAYDLDYAFERITLRANTLQAHRLIHWAQQRGEAQPFDVELPGFRQVQRGQHRHGGQNASPGADGFTWLHRLSRGCVCPWWHRTHAGGRGAAAHGSLRRAAARGCLLPRAR